MSIASIFNRIVVSSIVFGICAASVQAGLIHRYSFKDGAAKDSVGKVDGKLKGPASITDGKLVLQNGDKGSGDSGIAYLEFESSVLPKGDSGSLVFWFTAKDVAPFARILDIGDREGAEGRAMIYYTPKNADGKARAAITATDTASKTFLDSDPLDDGKPHMVAIVFDGVAKKLHVFVDGKEPVPAEDLGANTLDKVRPVNNWLGRSSFDQDPALTGSIEEFRVYDDALTLAQAAAIAKVGPDSLPEEEKSK
jgi:hypothetical protein